MFSEVRPTVFWIHPPSGGEVYVVRTEPGLVLMDSGSPGHREAVLEDMQQADLDPRDIRLAFITHAHCDHVGEMGWWREEFGFPVVAHSLAAGPIEKADPVITAAEIPFTQHSEEFVPCPIAHPVGGGEHFSSGERTFLTIHAPGHTIGSLHILSGEELFVGDTLFESGGIGWFDVHWGSNPEDYIETLDRMREHVGRLVLPGHGAPYLLEESQIDTARRAAEFYIPPEHGLGTPRVPSAYPKDGPA